MDGLRAVALLTILGSTGLAANASAGAEGFGTPLSRAIWCSTSVGYWLEGGYFDGTVLPISSASARRALLFFEQTVSAETTKAGLSKDQAQLVISQGRYEALSQITATDANTIEVGLEVAGCITLATLMSHQGMD